MSATDKIQAQEEHLRNLVRQLPDDKRLEFFRRSETTLKDPDTYATLNYLFIAGLHHFYLGKWVRGLLNISVFGLGLLLLLAGHVIVGGLIILAISTIELYALFNAQNIIQKYNNSVMQQIYNDLAK